jgi:peptide/nickel transport system substrate-binding protein
MRDGQRTRAGSALALLLAIALVAYACGRDAGGPALPAAEPQFINETTSDAPPVVGGQIVYGVPSETSSFNPALSTWGPYSLIIGRSIYDTLATYDDQGRVQPFLAEKFEPAPDYTSWTVTLRAGISYTNGKPVTAESVVAYQRALKASPVLSEAFDAAASWEVAGPLTYVMRSTYPWSQYPDAMASQIGVVVDPDWLTSDDITHPVGTGPFMVDHWDVNKEMVLKKNPKYWRKDGRGTALPYLDQVTFRIVIDEAARVEALRKGEIDIMMQAYATPSVGDMLAEAEAGKFQAFSDKRFETPEDYIVINTARPPFDDIDARRALVKALDLNDYATTVTGGLDEPADSPWKPGSPWYVPVDYPKYDPADSRRLVEAVKARHGGQFSVTLVGNQSNEASRIQQWLQQQWTKVGIDVKLETTLQQTKIIKLVQGDYELGLTQQFDDVMPGPMTVFWQAWNKPLGTLSLNFARTNDATLTRLAVEGLGAPPGPVQKEKYGQLSKRLAEVIPYVWLAHGSRSVIASPRLVNVVRSELPGGNGRLLEFIQGSHLLSQIWIKR